jgi:hippurate hydrolase
MIRTELDGLPVEEKTGLPYASTAKQIYNGRESFVDHACGHDIHMASWIGTAKVMATLKAKWHGTLVFVGQPAEEAIGGAKAMLADDFMTRFPKPDMGFALHVGAAPSGEVDYRPGAWTSTADTLEILFKGRGSHGSMPEKSIDPVLMASRFVVDVQSVISREKDPAEFGVVTIGTIQAGIAPNVIPDQARITGTIRTYDANVRAKILAGIERTANGEAAIAGAPAPEIAPFVGGATSVVNDEAITAKAGKVFTAAFGDKAVLEKRPGPASEDYSEFILAGIPSLAFGIGGTDPALVAAAKAGGKPVPVNHSPFFAPVPEPTIKTGVKAMSLVLLNVLSK